MVTDSIKLEHILLTSRKNQMELKNLYKKKSRLYSDHTSRYLCQQIHDKLPREIRDMIYGYMAGIHTVLVASSTPKPFGRRCLPQMFLTDTPSATPTYWFESQSLGTMRYFLPNVLGGIICQELVEVWYRNTTFIFEDSSLVIAFLCKNPWLFPIEPKAFVRHVRFLIPEGLLRPIAYKAQMRRENRRQYILVSAEVGIDTAKAAQPIAYIDFLHPQAKVQLHVVPGIDFNREDQLRLEPVQPWDKSQNSLSELLIGLTILEKFLAVVTLLESPRISLLLDRNGKCEIKQGQAVWSSLGWLARVMEWGLEEKDV